MSVASGSTAQRPSDESLLSRVQQENQARILGKLLHDLRNPVHSLRITMELFARIARRSGEVDVLIDRAARYMEPAEAALKGLIAVTGRFGLYLSPPAAPSISAVNVAECLDEVAHLLGGGGRQNRITTTLHMDETEKASLQLDADRPRLSHAVLRHCSLSDNAVRIDVTADAEIVSIDVQTEGLPASAAEVFRDQDFRTLIENAGGAITFAPRRATLRFRRTASNAG